MEYITESQILLHEELCCKSLDENDSVVKATILFRKNLRLVYYVTKRYRNVRYDCILDENDIIQAGFEGLWKACLGFDESKGFEFSTYAVSMIRGQILRELRNNNALHIPRWFKDIRIALSRHGFTLPLNDQEIDVLVSEGKFSRYQIMEYAEPDICSIDDSAFDEGSMTMKDIIPGDSLGIDIELYEEELEKTIDKVLSYVKPAHRDLVEEWIYATLAGEYAGQSDLAKKYGVSQVQVSRILKSATSLMKMHRKEIQELFGI